MYNFVNQSAFNLDTAKRAELLAAIASDAFVVINFGKKFTIFFCFHRNCFDRAVVMALFAALAFDLCNDWAFGHQAMNRVLQK